MQQESNKPVKKIDVGQGEGPYQDAMSTIFKERILRYITDPRDVVAVNSVCRFFRQQYTSQQRYEACVANLSKDLKSPLYKKLFELAEMSKSFKLKAVTVGDSGTNRVEFAEQACSEDGLYSKMAQGMDFIFKNYHIHDYQLKLECLDTIGVNNTIIPGYLKGASIVFLVCDMSKPETYKSIPEWKDRCTHSAFDPTTYILILNNSNSYQKPISESEIAGFAEKHGIHAWFATDPSNTSSCRIALDEAVSLYFINNFFKGYYNECMKGESKGVVAEMSKSGGPGCTIC